MTLIKKIIIFILTLESRLILAKYRPFIIAVTGSVGKTGTKDAIYAVLKNGGGLVRRNEKSFNSEIGLPLTILGLPNAWRNMFGWLDNIIEGLVMIIRRRDYPKTLVLEMGADHPGDIQKATRWLHPDIVVLTKISPTPAHVEFFASPEEVFKEKFLLAVALKQKGSLIFFADEAKMSPFLENVKRDDVKVISYGLNEKAMIHSSNYSTIYDTVDHPIGISFNLELEGNKLPIIIKNVIGKTHMYSVLAAVAVGRVRELSLSSIVESLENYSAPRGRMNIISGINNSVIIDDTYNSSPDAVVSALESLTEVKCIGTKIIILGDMMELGKYSAEEHRNIGRFIAKMPFYRLITVGVRARGIADTALENGMNHELVNSFASTKEATSFILSMIKPNDVVLVKGSQSVRMERIVAALIRDTEKVSELLVRQEKEWLDKV